MLKFKSHIKNQSVHTIDAHLYEFKSIKRLGTSFVRKIKATWTSLKSTIRKVFSSKLKKAPLFKEVIISIPGQIKEDIMKDSKLTIKEDSATIAVIKGNYNEALVMQNIYNYKGQGVEISKKYEPYRNPINQTVTKWNKDLKQLGGKSYNQSIKIIEKGSKDMTNYLISNTISENGTIVGGYLDNLAFQDGIDFKADIRIAVIKDGREQLDGYSLKLYSNKAVGLANTTAKGLCRHLAGDAAAEAFDGMAKTDQKLLALIHKSKRLNAIKQDHKKHLKGDEKATNRLKTLRALSDDEIEKLTQKDLEAQRKEARKPINPRTAAIVYEVLKPYAGTVEFGERILDIMGFNDKETKMLMAITTNKKSEILTQHPDLDLSKITLEDPKGRVTLNIKGPTGKTIVTFGVKEGEKKAVSGSVSFAGIEPEDYDEYI